MTDTSSTSVEPVNTARPTEDHVTARPTEDRVRRHVEDALELANFVISTGAKAPDGQPLPFEDIATIQTAAAQVGLINIPMEGPNSLSIDQWNKFEQAYYRIAAQMNPVTAETLRDTRDTARPHGNYASFWVRARDFFWGYSPAQRFTRELWFWALVFATFIIAGEWGINYLGLKKDAASVVGWRTLLQSLLPWAYGGLGACAYMLRSAHYFIYRRSFDTRRTPEYFNRILLGAISGGAAIILFTRTSTWRAEDGSAGASAAGGGARVPGGLQRRSVRHDHVRRHAAHQGSASGSSSPSPAAPGALSPRERIASAPPSTTRSAQRSTRSTTARSTTCSGTTSSTAIPRAWCARAANAADRWGHSKGMLAWNDDGAGVIMQVTTPGWPRSGSNLFAKRKPEHGQYARMQQLEQQSARQPALLCAQAEQERRHRGAQGARERERRHRSHQAADRARPAGRRT